MAKKAKQRRRRSPHSPSVRITRQRLMDGLSGPDGTRVRLARPEESARFGELLTLATEEIEQAHIDAVAAGQCGTWLLDGLMQGGEALTDPLVRAAASGQLQDGALAMSLPMVAEERDGTLTGALLGLPPGAVVQTVREAGYEQHSLLAMLKYAKIKGLAVAEEARRRGVGGALLKRCIQVYWQLNFVLLYGGFEIERALGPYYARHGFTVLNPGETTDVGFVLTGRPIGLGAGPGEQLFYRWR
ncbi:GNAT family N-acetyltransferase [Streptomyces sp. HNM0663]|uniref:GNAT family N-acetyltransferase n=1 Tax=Streptomyces chengmaiensis TaxID=3040919 RepID=A0ABT6HZW0_9ACTN|nr:GNAT family N-acetyltransferase [Streptomyces chengmaiensis]MDH2393379.1 GNAT family N-acetyltransferase [Streptomyces chengmaiensis]